MRNLKNHIYLMSYQCDLNLNGFMEKEHEFVGVEYQRRWHISFTECSQMIWHNFRKCLAEFLVK